MSIDITQADVMDWLATLPDEHATAVFCDPPYGLGFMGKQWDHGVPSSDVWREVLRVCKPGAVLLAFGGTRTEHRLAVNIEDAGWEIYDKFLWLYGSGFPKSANIGKMIDKAAGAEREVIAEYSDNGRKVAKHQNTHGVWEGDAMVTITAPATPDAATWDGYGTSLKPAYEPVIVARKPRRGTYAQTAVEHGTGALWIDGCRVGLDGERPPSGSGDRRGSPVYAQDKWTQNHMANGGNVTSPSGRWPANLALVHEEECELVGTVRVKGNVNTSRGRNEFMGPAGSANNGTQLGPHHHADADGMETVDEWRCVEGCPVRMLGEQSGDIHGAGHARNGTRQADGTGLFGMAGDGHRFGDTGTAARFFYQGKSSRSERDAGLDSTYTVKYNVSLNGGALCKNVTMALVTSLQKATFGLAVKWHIGERGVSITGLCQSDILSTTLTAISRITASQILSLSMPLLTSEFTQDASLETVNGGSLAVFAESSSQSQANSGISQKKDGLNTEDAENVISELLSVIRDGANWQPLTNIHSTVKPLAVCEYMARLILPPEVYRDDAVLLVPYAGSGSEMIGAWQAGWRNVDGCERETEYVEIARRRVAHWCREPLQPALIAT